MVVDSTYMFEKRRQVPMKYDRELWSNTLMAMKRVQEIRERRERQHIKNRCASLLIEGIEFIYFCSCNSLRKKT